MRTLLVAEEPARHKVAQAAGVAELQLQQWAQLGEASLMELLHKDAHTEWGFVCTRDGIEGFSAPPPADRSAPASAATTHLHHAPCLPAASGRSPPL